MKHLFNFLGKVAELVIVFTAVFVTPAAMLGLIWIDLSIYEACVTNPTYCAVMFVMAAISVSYYVSRRVDNNRKRNANVVDIHDRTFG